MKAITLWQPWATLVAIGAKRIETRSWATSYRGLIAIHAAKNFPSEAWILIKQPVFWNLLAAALCLHATDARWHERLPLGAVVAIGYLELVVPITNQPEIYNLQDEGIGNVLIPPRGRENSFGDYRPGRYAWILNNMRALKEPIPARGAQGLWEWTPPGELEFK